MSKKLLELVVSRIVSTPFYPHWLNNLKSRQLERGLLIDIKGKVLEVGAGDTTKRDFILQNNPSIKKYVVTDYSTWDDEFKRIEKLTGKFSKLSSLFFGFKDRGTLDAVCDAMNLPFKDNSFDCHLSFEVLEHISDPFKYFSEAKRVLKKGGTSILSVPVFYRVHGIGNNHAYDFFRYMPGFFFEIGNKYNFQIDKVYFNTGLGTTFAQMTNQYLIEKIRSSHVFLKIPLLIAALVYFPISNVTGYLIDLNPDIRFSNRYFVKLRKK